MTKETKEETKHTPTPWASRQAGRTGVMTAYRKAKLIYYGQHIAFGCIAGAAFLLFVIVLFQLDKVCGALR